MSNRRDYKNIYPYEEILAVFLLMITFLEVLNFMESAEPKCGIRMVKVAMRLRRQPLTRLKHAISVGSNFF